MDTAKVIKQRREELSLTQRDIALRLGITDKTVSNWERGISKPVLEAWQFGALCELLQCQLKDLYKEGDRDDGNH